MNAEYVAGFFDGEGSIGIYRNGRGNFHLRTQLTQNITPSSERLLKELHSKWGGNLNVMRSDAYKRGGAYNWQLNSASALKFLEEIAPFLVLKRDQAELAIAWQKAKPKPERDKFGRMVAARREHPDDIAAEKIMKALKSFSLEELMAAQADHVEIIHELRQVVCVKG